MTKTDQAWLNAKTPNFSLVEYLSGESLLAQAESTLVTEWLNGLTISARLTLAARLLNFTAEDMPSAGRLGLVREYVAAMADECGKLAEAMTDNGGEITGT